MSVKTVPYNIEAEEAALGSLIVDPQAYPMVSAFLRVGHFYLEKNRWMYEAIASLCYRGCPIDLVTLCEELESKNRLVEVGGAAYIGHLINAVPSAMHVEQYAKIIKDKARRRDMIRVASSLAKAAYREDNDLDSEVSEVAAALWGENTGEGEIGEHIASAREDLLKWSNDPLSPGEVRGISTGLVRLDAMLGGLEPSLIVCGARTSVGKSAFVSAIAKNVASQGLSVLYVTKEMLPKQLVHRMAASTAGVSWMKAKEGRLSEGEMANIQSALDILYDIPLQIKWASTIARILSLAHSHRAKYGLDVLIADGLGLYVSREEKDRQLKLGGATQTLLDLAGRLEVPIITTHQTKRTDDKPGTRPKLEHFQWSSMIEQDTDIALFLTREELNTSFADGRPNPKGREMKVWCLKDRLNGRLGVATLYFGEHAEIRDPAYSSEVPPAEGQGELF